MFPGTKNRNEGTFAKAALLLGGSQWGWCRWGRSDSPLFSRIFPLYYAFFPLFSRIFAFFPLFSRIFPLFLRFSLLLLMDKGQQQQFTAKMGNFTPTPSAPTPCETSRFYETTLLFPLDLWALRDGCGPGGAERQCAGNQMRIPPPPPPFSVTPVP